MSDSNASHLRSVAAALDAFLAALDAQTDEELLEILNPYFLVDGEWLPEIEGIVVMCLRAWRERRPQSRIAKSNYEDFLAGIGWLDEYEQSVRGDPVPVIDIDSEQAVNRRLARVEKFKEAWAARAGSGRGGTESK